MLSRIASFIFLLSVLQGFGQGNYEVKVMSWNVLNWPSTSNTISDTTDRCPAYRSVINYVNPDVIVTMENTGNNSAPWFLNQGMNSGQYHYASGTFINGYDTDNAIYYRDSLFDFISNQPVNTSLRDINNFTLVFKATGDTLHIFSLHLKASQGYEQQRAQEVAALRQVTNAFPEGTNFLIAGDFNIYNSSEPAYVDLLQDNTTDDGNVLDALHLTGTWNNFSYAPYHTQSTRISSAGGGSGGGMNDRFDMILYSNGIADPTGIYYMPGTYGNIGNDGHHFDDAINYGTNTAVPQTVADALFDASDHLPVVLTLSIGPTSGINNAPANFTEVDVFPDPVQSDSKLHINLKGPGEIEYTLYDLLGNALFSSDKILLSQGQYLLPIDWKNVRNPGFYFISVKINNSLISRKLILLNSF